MGLRWVCSSLVLVLAPFHAPAIAEVGKTAASLSVTNLSYSLVSSSASSSREDALPAAALLVRLDASMPRDLPEIHFQDAAAIPTAELDWHPAEGAVIKLLPAKLRFSMGF